MAAALAVQLIVVALLLAGTGLAYTRYPTKGIDLETGNPQVGITAEWAKEHLTGVPAAWHKNANLGHAVDLVVLNWFPRPPVAEKSKSPELDKTEQVKTEELKPADPESPPPAQKLEVIPFEYNGGGYRPSTSSHRWRP